MLVVVCVACLSVTQTGATETGALSEWETMPTEYGAWQDSLPEDVQDALPNGMFSEDRNEAYEAVKQAVSLGSAVQMILSLVGVRMSDCVGLAASLLGLILLSAVLQNIQAALGGKGSEMFGFCVRLTMFAAVVAQGVVLLQNVKDYFAELQALTTAMVPTMSVLYALGGNLTQAVANQEILMAVLAVIQYIGSSTVLPMCGACLALALLEAFRSSVRLDAVSGLIKKWYASFLGLLMTVLTAVFSAQSVLTARADNLNMKGVKYAVGSMLPVVGGAVSGTLGTVAAGVGVLRSVCGVCGIILIALLLLPTLIQLLLYRATFQLAGTVAGMLRCDGEAKLLGEVASLYGYVAAVVGICSVVFVVALAVLVGGSVAVA